MKKIISIILLICTFTLCLASCGGDNNNDDNNLPETPTDNPIEENHTPYDAFVFYPQSSDTYVVGISDAGKYYTEIIIPSTYNGGKVVGIIKEGFKDCESITSVKIPNTVIEIKKSAFYDCENLKTIEFSNSVKSIEEDAFTNCGKIESVFFNGTIQDWIEIDNLSNPLRYYRRTDLYINGELFTTLVVDDVPSLTEYEISKYFSYCGSLKTVIISDYAYAVREKSFMYCVSLENVTISNNVTEIEESAFEECSSLKSITIPNSVKRIENYAFAYCTSLNDINFEGTKSEWNSITKGSKWDIGTSNYTIYCTDGTITK